jgi:hypothetical protein
VWSKGDVLFQRLEKTLFAELSTVVKGLGDTIGIQGQNVAV